MASFFSSVAAVPSSDATMIDSSTIPPAANLTPAPTVGGEIAEKKPEPDVTGPTVHFNDGNKPGEPEWVTHSGVEGRPYITEEIHESPNKVELEGEFRCQSCKDLERSCVTILKFPNPPAYGDLDLCGYCAKEGKKPCGAGKLAYQAHLSKLVQEEGNSAISKRRGRRVSNKPASPDMSSTPDQASIASKLRRRSLSTDTDTTDASAPKRQKVAIRRKSGPTPRTPATPGVESTITNDDSTPKIDGRKDPAKVALRVVKMKATLAAKREERLAAKAAEEAANAPPPPPKGRGGNKSTPKANGNAAAETKANTVPKPALKMPRSVQTPIRTRGPRVTKVAPEDDFLHRDFVGITPKSAEKAVPARKILAAHHYSKSNRPNATAVEHEEEVNALLGSIEQPLPGMDDDSDDIASTITSSFDDLEQENEQLKKSLAKLEAREKKLQLREENEVMKKRIDELRRKSLTRRESSSMLQN